MKTNFIFSLVLAVAFISCKKDNNQPVCNGETPTYSDTINVIIGWSCAGGGNCHNTGSANGDFTSYEGLKPYLDDGHFEHHVLDKQDMPPTRIGRPLSSDELSLLQCWLENDYAE